MKQAGDPHGLLAAGYRQPDQLSCGATAGVVAAALLDAPLAASLRETPDLFRQEVLRLHRHLTGLRAPDGGTQMPWPRALGTPPWALTNHLEAVTGQPHRVRLLRGPGGPETRTRMRKALEGGSPVVLYVGDRWTPRHVVLALPPTLVRAEAPAVALYDPATGRVRREQLGPGGRDRLDRGWPVPWFALLPRDC